MDGREREFVYYPGSFEPLAIIDDTKAIYLIHTDSAGLPHEVTDEDGKIVWSASFNALGDLDKIYTNDFNNPIRFQGQYYDPEIDLSYNRHRYFDSKTGSFVSRDPLGLAAGENVYAYAPNVWGWIDPLGLCSTSPPVLPPMSGPDNTFYHMQQGYFVNQYSSAMNSAFDSRNAIWERGVYGVLALLTAPVAGVEEIARGIYNAPYDVVNAGKRLGERSARAGILADQGYYGDATLEGLYAVQDFSTGFTAAGTYAVPIAGALESSAARSSLSTVVDDAAGFADDVAPKTTGITKDVYQARTSPKITQSVLDKIDPTKFSPDTRFGKAFYVAEEGDIAVAEVASHGTTPTHVIRYKLDLSKAKVLDLTDPAIVEKWGSPGGNNYARTKAIAKEAQEAGFDAIKFPSQQASGNNIAIFDKFDEILTPQMVTQVK